MIRTPEGKRENGDAPLRPDLPAGAAAVAVLPVNARNAWLDPLPSVAVRSSGDVSMPGISGGNAWPDLLSSISACRDEGLSRSPAEAHRRAQRDLERAGETPLSASDEQRYPAHARHGNASNEEISPPRRHRRSAHLGWSDRSAARKRPVSA